jgi:hypothetical protein
MMLKNLVKRILQELLFHYIKQKAKQTLKRQDNSSQTTFLRNRLTTEHQGTTIATYLTDTSEKTTMETMIEPVVQIRDWSIDRIHELSDTKDHQKHLNALAIAQEFDEWLVIPEGVSEIDYLCIQEEID